MRDNLIAITELCSYEEIEVDFIYALVDFGLIDTQINNKTAFIDVEELPKLIRLKHLHKDLEINLEGLHAITQVLSQLDNMRNELQSIKNELNYYKQLDKHID